MKRKNISSNTIWEEIVGYSRAVRAGNTVEVSGTASLDGDEIVGISDAYYQTKFILQKISKALNEAGANLTDVVRTRIYVTDSSNFNEVAKAHREVFKDIKPATSLIEIKSLVHPDMLVEIEATAIVGD